MTLRADWERVADVWVRWAREPGLDSYWRFHRDQFLALLPRPGRRTLDLGCGEGRLARDLTALGHHVVAIDVSPTMVAAARQTGQGIETLVADAAGLPFTAAAFDLVVAFMSLQDVDAMERAVAEAARVLEPGGRICVAIVHPFQVVGRFTSDDDDAPFVVEGSYLDAHHTVDVVERAGIQMTFASQHRPLETYSRAIEDAGLLIRRLREPRTRKEDSGTGRWMRLPLFLHVEAFKPSRAEP